MFSLPHLPLARAAALPCCILLSAPHLGAQGGSGTPPTAVQPGVPAPQAALRITPAGPLALSPDSFPRALYVRSLSPETLSVTVRFYESEPDTSVAAILVSPDTLSLPPGATARISVQLRLARLRRLPYSGYVYVAARGATAEAVDVSVVRRVRPSASPGRRADRWSTEIRRHALFAAGCDRLRWFGTCTRRGVLPLESYDDGATILPPDGTVLGYVSDSTGRGAARVSSAGAARVYGGAAGMRLAFTGLDRVGRYTGEIAADGARGSPTVGLTVLVGHGLPFPALAVLAGIVFAWPIGWLAKRERVHRRIRSGLSALGDDHTRAQEELEARLAGIPTRYTQVRSAAELQGDLRRRYETLAGAGKSGIDATPLLPLLAELSAVRGRLRRLPTLGTEVARLAAVLEAFSARDEARPPGMRRAHPPAVLEAARRALNGRPLSPGEIPAAIREVAAATLAVRSWCRLNRAARDAWSVLEGGGGGPLPPPAEERIEEARRRVGLLWAELWEERFDPAEWAQRLDAVDDEIRTLRGHPRERKSASAVVAEERARDGVAAGLSLHIPEPGEDLGAVAGWVGSPERLVSALVLLAAVLLALETLYFSTPAFGTPRDYVTAFLWGFGAKAGLEAVKTLADPFMNRGPMLGGGS